MDPVALQHALNGPARNARAVMPVHLYGHPADMDRIMQIAQENNLVVIEDCAQAHGSTFHGQRVGGIGHLGTFSFYPTKNLGALGDGGAITTNESTIADRLRMLRQYGWRERFISEAVGVNSRLDELQAAILRVKLPHLEADNKKRRSIAALYARGLDGLPLQLPKVSTNCEHVFHQFTVETDRRDDLQHFLSSMNIGTSVLYPVPVHLQPAYYGRILCAGSLFHTERAAKRILSLPIYPELQDGQVEEICRAIRTFFG
jgi:dTDP-4-amino-4,6-dideoxygalactose transaminase